MKLQNLFTDDSAVSPVVGVILMVAITVLLAATAASFFLGLTNGTTTSTPTVAFGFDYENRAEDIGGSAAKEPVDRLTISHNGGDTLNPDQVDIAVQDAVNSQEQLNPRKTWTQWKTGSVSSVQAGASITIDRTDVPTGSALSGTDGALSLDDASVKVVWTSPDSSQTFILAEWSSPNG